MWVLRMCQYSQSLHGQAYPFIYYRTSSGVFAMFARKCEWIQSGCHQTITEKPSPAAANAPVLITELAFLN